MLMYHKLGWMVLLQGAAEKTWSEVTFVHVYNPWRNVHMFALHFYL